MPHFHIEDFRRGLDTRKAAFTAPPGSLRDCMNAHITRGGEIEKRMTLGEYAELPDGTFGLHSLRDEVYVFGSKPEPSGLPPGIRYQRLEPPHFANMTRLLSTCTFGGQIYAVAEYDDGAVYHFFGGNRVDAPSNLEGLDAVVRAFEREVNERTTYLTATTDDALIITSTEPGETFTVGSELSDDDIEITTLQDAEDPVVARPAVAETELSVNFPDPIPQGDDPEIEITAVYVDGSDALGSSISVKAEDYIEPDNAADDLAQWIADAINNAGFGVQALADGSRITVESEGPDHGDWNGRELEIVYTEADGAELSLTEATPVFEDGISESEEDEGQVQVTQVKLEGSFDPVTQYNIQLNGDDIRVLGKTVGVGRFVMTFQDRIWSIAQSLLYFTGFDDSGNPDPTIWYDPDEPDNLGAGFVNMATQEGGAETLTGIGVYQNQLAIFSRRSVQIWAVDPDPENLRQEQVIPNIGTVAPRSIQSFGDMDLFFLSESGIRSLRARDSSNIAAAQDVGTPVDSEVTRFLQSLTGGQRQRAQGVLEPTTGRYWLAVGGRVYVYSHFPGSDISAWSQYDFGRVDNIAASPSRVYVRSGSKVYLYGGLAGDQYSADDEVDVWLPFLDAERPGDRKVVTSIGVGCEGEWDVYIHPDPTRPGYAEFVATVEGTTFGLQPTVPARAVSSHFSFRLRNRAEGYARLTSFVIHYSHGDAS